MFCVNVHNVTKNYCNFFFLDTCRIHEEMKKIHFKGENDTICVTRSEIRITYCKGACDSYDSSIIYNLDGDVVLHEHECECCTGGRGELQTITVDCFEKGLKEIKIRMLIDCECNVCEDKSKC